MDAVAVMAMEFWTVLGQMAPYLLFGFLFAGVLSVLITPATVERHLGGKGIWPVVKAAVFGVPLPLCSCGVIPVAASLRRHGASRSATTSFLLSTPQTGIDSILVTYGLLGPVFAVFRPLAALASGLLGGLVISFTADARDQDDLTARGCEEACCADSRGRGAASRILTYALVTLPRDISKALLLGLVIAGVISAAIPDDYFASLLGAGFGAMVLMMLVGIPVYVCATASVPVAAALVAKGVSPGAALVFLMAGPVTNAAAVATVWRVMGKRTALIYLVTAAATALACGVVLDQLFTLSGAAVAAHTHELLPAWVKTLSAVTLLLVMAAAISRPGRTHSDTESIAASGEQAVAFSVTGMSCSHCVESVRRAVQDCSGVASAEVDLKPGRVVVTGREFDVEAIRRGIEGLGFGVARDVELLVNSAC